MEQKYQEYLEKLSGPNYYSQCIRPEIIDIKEHYAKAKLELRPDLSNSIGIFHGGVIYGLGDILVGLAVRTSGDKTVTLEGNINYISNVTEGYIYAETNCLHHGRSSAVYEVNFTNKDGKRLAIARYTMMLFGGKGEKYPENWEKKAVKLD